MTAREGTDPDMPYIGTLPRKQYPLFAAVGKVVRETWNPLGIDARRRSIHRGYDDCEREVFEIASRGGTADVIAACLARFDGSVHDRAARDALDRRAAEAVVAARTAFAGTGDLTALGCVRRPGYRSMVHRSRRMSDELDGCNFHLERRVAPDELEQGLAQVLGLAEGAVRSVEREIQVTGRWLWSGGVDAAHEHPGAGFGTHCELRCDLDGPTPPDVLVALSAVLGTRALCGVPDFDDGWRCLIRPDGAVSVTGLDNVPGYEDDGRALLVPVRAPRPWRRREDDGARPFVPALLAELARRVRDGAPPGWTRARLELACGGAGREDGWRRELFADVSFDGELRHFEIDEPTRIDTVLTRIGRALDGDGPAVRHVLATFEPGAGPRATLVEPEASDGPSTTRFPASCGPDGARPPTR